MDSKKRGRPLEQSHIDWMMEHYAPKGVRIEHQIELTAAEKDEAEKYGIRDKISKNMAHTFNGVNDLREKYERENEIKYDLVIVTRPDIIFFEPLNLSKIFSDFSSDEINNAVFYADIPMLSTPNYDINFCRFICGIDLFLMGGGRLCQR
jgi:hypothetical protein